MDGRRAGIARAAGRRCSVVSLLLLGLGCAPTEVPRDLSSYRPFEARLTVHSGSFDCRREPAHLAQCDPDQLELVSINAARCSPSPEPGTRQFSALRELATGLRRDAARDSTPASIHRRAARRLLLLGELDSVEESVQELRRAIVEEPSNAAFHSDLAAAYLRQATLARSPELLALAYESADRALELRPGLDEARFNRALALERLGLVKNARQAWLAYLERDPQGPWAAEVRERAEKLDLDEADPWADEVLGSTLLAAIGDPPTLRRYLERDRQRAREWAQTEGLGEWAALVLSGQPQEAATLLASLRVVAQALAQASGDRLLLDSIEAIRGADAHRVARGLRAVNTGLNALYADWRPADAADSFEQARRELTAARSPFRFWAEFYLGLTDYYLDNYERAETGLATLARELPAGRYPALEGRIAWIRGLAAASIQDLEASSAHYAAAARLFCRLGEEQNLAATRSLLANTTSRRGQATLAWKHSYNALVRTGHVFNPLRHHAILEDTIQIARRHGLERVALALSDVHLDVAARTGGAQILHNAHMRRASILGALGRADEANDQFGQAIAALEGLDSTELRVRADADRALDEGAALLSRDPRAAIDRADEALAAFLSRHNYQKLPEAYRLRGLAHLELGNQELAERDLRERLRLLELALEGIGSDVDRASFQRRIESAFEDLIRLATRNGQTHRAFHFAERSRTARLRFRLAGEALGVGPAAPASPVVSVERLRDLLDEKTVLVEIEVLADEILIWALDESGMTPARAPVSRQELRTAVDELERVLEQGPGSAFEPASERLHGLLIQPIQASLAGRRRAVFVTDEFLDDLPFDLLLDPGENRFLGERLEISHVPSLSLWLELSLRAAELSANERPPQLLAVYGTTDGSGRFPGLAGAEAEVRAIAGLHKPSRVMAASAQTKSELLSRIAAADFFHFAGHALAAGVNRSELSGRGEPGSGALVLEDTARRTTYLDVEEMGASDLGDLRLVVLSGCQTGSSDGSGPLSSLTWPYLSAGVPAIVATLWKVDDEATAHLMLEFYREMRKGRQAGEALWRAKNWARGRDSPKLSAPRFWGAFRLSGTG